MDSIFAHDQPYYLPLTTVTHCRSVAMCSVTCHLLALPSVLLEQTSNPPPMPHLLCPILSSPAHPDHSSQHRLVHMPCSFNHVTSLHPLLSFLPPIPHAPHHSLQHRQVRVPCDLNHVASLHSLLSFLPPSPPASPPLAPAHSSQPRTPPSLTPAQAGQRAPPPPPWPLHHTPQASPMPQVETGLGPWRCPCTGRCRGG